MTVGSGGTLVEVVDDTAIRIPPVSAGDVRSAVEEIALGARLRGCHNGTDYDVEAFVDLVERVGRLATDVDAIAELDMNPVIVGEDGITVVDVLVRTR